MKRRSFIGLLAATPAGLLGAVNNAPAPVVKHTPQWTLDVYGPVGKGTYAGFMCNNGEEAVRWAYEFYRQLPETTLVVLKRDGVFVDMDFGAAKHGAVDEEGRSINSLLQL